ncbi:MAG: metal ABC transporter permease [Myxococcales bacterium]|nr:metal ABC transporter permease [Myxococcales bacterium]
MGYLDQLISINGLPLLACLAVSGILVYLGMHVVERKVIFVDLALAQIAALGVMWAILMGYDHETETLAVTLYSLAFTAVGALIFSITRTRNERVPHEALIGIIYVTATAGGLVLADRFALGTEALKELIAGRVALVTPAILTKLVITCALVGAVFLILHRRLMRISADPAAAEAAGMSIRAWDFVFYLLFGVLITQSVSVLGVLPVFAYLVIPAVAAAFLFESVRARLIFGWIFAGVISLVGLETARASQLDPGPTIVCLFAAALVILGVFLFLRARGFAGRAVLQVVGLAVVFAAFLGGTLMFRKPQRTDELAAAVEFARSGDPTHMRQAMVSFRNFPDERTRWIPLVLPMVSDADPVVRDAATTLLVEVKAVEAAAPLAARLGPGVEPDDNLREGVIRALRALGDASVVPALVDAAAREEEPDLAVALAMAGFDLAVAGHDDELRRAGDVLIQIATDDGAPRAARRDAADALHAHVAIDPAATDDAARAAWWRAHRDLLVWQAEAHRLTAPAGDPGAPPPAEVPPAPPAGG